MRIKSFYLVGKCTVFSCCCLLLLISCSSKLPSTTSERQTSQQQIQTPTKSAERLLQLAAQQSLQQEIDGAITTLLQTSHQLLAEQQPSQALWLTNQLKPLVYPVEQQSSLLLIQAEAWQALQQAQNAWHALKAINEVAKLNQQQQLTYYRLLSQIQQQRHYPVLALDAKIRYLSLAKAFDATESIELWRQLNQLADWQVARLQQLAPPDFAGWQQLLLVGHRFGSNSAQFSRNLQNWRRNNQQHPANAIVDALIAENQQLHISSIARIAVILPLTGKQRLAGEVAQQGVLAAYATASQTELLFIDSDQLDIKILAEQLTKAQIDVVIGPLLTENVEQYVTQDNLNLPTLLLNYPAQQRLKANQVVFSMRPEDESIQAANTLSHHHYQQPLIISQSDEVSRRISQAFIEQWQKHNEQAPEIVYFEQDQDMQLRLQQSLDVDLSKQRIADLVNQVRQPIKSETRNRRDIDMIYLVGSAQETRLLKPFLDVYTSPFAEIIPVFASSRSHSAKQDRKDTRDLSGLTFTEMPWLLAGNQQDQALAQTNLRLWPERSDSLQRIFAMGYDSLSLVTKIPLMQQANYIRHFGQTGVIQLTEQQILSRTLLWGRYRNNSVQQIAM